MSLLSSVMAQIIRAVAPPVGGEYHELVLDAAPLGYWRMDETSGTTLVDATTGNDGVISGTYTLDIAPTAEVTGRAIKFTNAGVVPASIGTLPTGGAGGFCNEFLVKLFVADAASNAYILLRQNTGDVIFNFGGANRIGIFKNTGAGGAVATTAFGPTIPRDDAWHHVVIGWNPTNSRYEAYLDGVLDSFYVQTAPTLNNTVFTIGRVSAGSSPFVGGLDEFAVYDRFLTPTEIADHAYRALVGPLAALWTPAEITTALWLDAADTGTVTLNAGVVEQWDDKSGNLRHVSQTATPAARPGYTSGVSVNFDGSNDILFRTDAFMYAAGAGTTYVVAKWTAASSATLIAEGSSTTNNTVYDRRQHTTGGIMTCFIRNDANSIRLDPANTLGGVGADNTFKIQCWRDTETEVSSFVNGVDGGTPRAYTRSGALTPNRFAVGGLQRASAALFSTAEVSEVIHVAEASTPAERQRIEGYLAWKWGLQASLPPGHPYELAAPLLDPSTFDPALIGTGVVLSNGDLDMTKAGAGYKSAYGTRGRSSGIYAFEFEVVSRVSVSSLLLGFADKSNSGTIAEGLLGISAMQSIGYNDNNGSGSGRVYRQMTAGTDSGAVVTAYAPTDIITVSLDFGTNIATFYKNGVSIFTRTFTAGLEYFPVACVQSGPVARLIGSGLTHLPAGATEWDG